MGCGGDGWLYRMDLEALGVEGLRELCGCGRSGVGVQWSGGGECGCRWFMHPTSGLVVDRFKGLYRGMRGDVLSFHYMCTLSFYTKIIIFVNDIIKVIKYKNWFLPYLFSICLALISKKKLR